MNLFLPLDSETSLLLEKLLDTIEQVFPLPRRFAAGLARDVEELSALFTSRRSDQSYTYLGKPNLLSAYLRYFLPWNVFRLAGLLASLPLDLKNGDTVLDIGSGPLTFVLALWISRPDLRGLTLEFAALDRTPSVLEAGKKLFGAFTADRVTPGPWKIKTLRGELLRNGFRLSGSGKGTFFPPEKLLRGKNAALVSAVNVFNEIYWDLSPVDLSGQEKLAEQNANVLTACAGNGSVLIVEPGIPRSGEFISNLRSSLLAQGFNVVSPCLHNGGCPFPGSARAGRHSVKWCHFSLDADSAPLRLRTLSRAAGIPKDRAVLSFILAGKTGAPETMEYGLLKAEPGPREPASKIAGSFSRDLFARVLSDSFPVGGSGSSTAELSSPGQRTRPGALGGSRFGRYACSAAGPVLVIGTAKQIAGFDSGSVAAVRISGQRDPKSGAFIGELL